jgi:hypothetical protein
VVTIFSEAEGGRRTPPHNGVRRDFGYAKDNASGEIYCIWPDFFAREDRQYLETIPLPIGVPLFGRFLILVFFALLVVVYAATWLGNPVIWAVPGS